MTRRSSILLVFVIIVLVVLLVVSSTDLVIKEKQHETSRISVIMPNVNNEIWVNVRKGMERAAVEYNVDLTFVTLLPPENILKQQNLILREAEDNAQALILTPLDSERIGSFLQNNKVDIPIITLYSEVEAPSVKSSIGADWYEMGRSLAQAIVDDGATNHVVVATNDGVRQNVEEACRGIFDMIPNAIHTEILPDSKDKDMNTLLESLPKDGATTTLVVPDPTLLYNLIQNRSGDKIPNILLYGVAEGHVAKALEDRVLQAVTLCSGYDMGYTSVEAAVTVLENPNTKKDYFLEHTLVRPENVYEKDYSLLLFPIP